MGLASTPHSPYQPAHQAAPTLFLSVYSFLPGLDRWLKESVPKCGPLGTLH